MSVSDALWVIGVGLVLVELADPADVMVCDAVKRFPPRFDSSNAFSASCVNADGDDLAGNSCRTAEFAGKRGGKLSNELLKNSLTHVSMRCGTSWSDV